MTKDTRNFTKGRMNKELDERLVPNGEYIDALNIRIGSTEEDDMGVIETTLGNTKLTDIKVQGTSLSRLAICIGAFEDGTNETIYWFLHDPTFSASSNTNKLDLILSFNTQTSTTTYHVISMDDGDGVNTTLNFNPTYLITGVNKVEDLLFFTDDINPPRRINITKSYGEPTVADVDTITSEELLVIKKPPSQSPSVDLSYNENITSTFLEERLICFAYRWRYADNEYSATSQFSAPAFSPQNFNFTTESFLNEGMINEYNTAAITFNTGGALVLGIDLLFKEADDSTIKVIEKLDKEELGYGDNNDLVYNFSDSKIFTILPESEILRLYDNVPKLAQAQTIMGNRLMYGNYEEGYDLIDLSGNPTRLEYVASLIATTPTSTVLTSGYKSIVSATYSLPEAISGGVPCTIDAKAEFDLSPLAINTNGTSALKAGSTFEFTFRLQVDATNLNSVQYFGAGSAPAQLPPYIVVDATFTLAADYDSVEDWVNSSAFQNAVGTSITIRPVSSASDPTSCSGGTFTDNYNCGDPQFLGQFLLYSTGKDSNTTALIPQAIEATHINGTNKVSFIFPGLWYARAPLPTSPTLPTDNYFIIYEILGIECVYTNTSESIKSLHSNRGYEVGIMYMDDYGRSTTALVSPNNAIQVPCKNSDLENKIRIEIPPTQLAPSWATRYKFGIKPDRDGYNTIYSNIFFRDDSRNLVYILLQGENARKVEEGDRLIVKRDTDGPTHDCDYITVLEKKAFAADEVPNVNAVAGTYMVIESTGLSLEQGENSIIKVPELNAKAGDFWNIGEDRRPFLFIPFNLPVAIDAGCTGEDFDIPAGSIIKLKIDFRREGKDNNCEQREYNIDREYTSTEQYEDLAAWFIGDGISQTLISEDFYTGGDPIGTASFGGVFNAITTTPCPEDLEFNDQREQDLLDLGVPSAAIGEFRFSILNYSAAGNRTFLAVCGTRCCGSSKKKKSFLTAKLEVVRANELLVFETIPQDSSPDLFYESSASYTIDTATGYHNGNVQNQTSSNPAKINTAFFNCYAYGNGIESYKVRDSVEGKSFLLGNRATTTAGQDYKEVKRYADITYSGVYNQESNVNKLNEFNLGLLNFKPLEQFFGPIQKLFARETDVLVLQEDKISYVLAGKNLLSDAVGGGAVTSVPEVLGTQIARIEEYGISKNPESFTSHGADKYFTDAKRGAVLQLRGTAGQNEALMVISDQNMSTWFRDLFQVSFDYQKLGGYDEYANEYVLSSNVRALPAEEVVIPCGTTQTYIVSGAPIVYTVNVGDISEGFEVVTTVLDGAPSASVVYDNSTYPITVPGTTTIPKPNTKPTTAVVTLRGTGTIQITVECPQGELINIIQVCITSANDANALIHNEFGFVQGSYTSPTQSTEVQFSTSVINPIISQYETFTGYQGEGIFPSDNSTVTIASNKIAADTYVYEVDDDLLSLRTNASYPNTAIGISNLLAAASSVTPAGASPYVSGTFNMGTTGTNLYLIYDYRDKKSVTNLCFDASLASVACCCTATGTYYLNGSNLSNSTGIYTNATLTTAAAQGWYSDGSTVRFQTVSTGLPSLGVSSTCGDCLPDCDVDEVEAEDAGLGLYTANFEMGASSGAVVVKYTPYSVSNGIRATYNGIYNKLTSTNYGKIQSSTPGNFTISGTNSSECPDIEGTDFYLKYIANNTSYQLEGGSEEITIAASDIFPKATVPGLCIMVIPKTVAKTDTLKIENIVPCEGAQWSVEVACAAFISPTLTSSLEATSPDACFSGTTRNHYFVAATGVTGGNPALHSYVFTDQFGATPSLNGFIAVMISGVSTWFQISDGIIVASGTC